MKKLFILCILVFALDTYGQNEKIVTLVVTGQGKTQDEAKQNALRSAIEQAYGVFISSKTEIVNDKLVKDEIISVTSGNIQNYTIISEVKLSENRYSVTLNTTVSVSKLISYCQNKGYEIEFNGSLFAMNINLQKLNEESEYKAIKNLCDIGEYLLRKSLDYTCEVSEPVSTDGTNDLFELEYKINAKFNQTFVLFFDLMLNTLNGVKMSQNEIDSYKKVNKNYYVIKEYTEGINGINYDLYSHLNELKLLDKYSNKLNNEALQTYCLRNPRSIEQLKKFLFQSQKFLFNVKVSSNIETIDLYGLNTNDGLKWLLKEYNSRFNLNINFKTIGGVMCYKFKRKYKVEDLSRMKSIKVIVNP